MPDPKIKTILKFVEFDFHMTSLDFPGGSDRKESACSAGDLGSVPALGRSPGGRHGNPLQYSCLENPKVRGSWWVVVRRVTKSWTRLK